MTSRHVFWLTHGVWLFGFLLAAVLFGRRSLREIEFNSAAERTVFSLGLGMGAVGTGIFVLGLLRLMTRETVLVLLIGFAVWGGAGVWRPIVAGIPRTWARGRLQPWRTAGKIAAGAAALLLLKPMVKLALYPPHLWDGISYHLAAAKIYCYWYGLVPTPSLRFAVFPQLNEMLFAAMLLLADDVGAQLLECTMMLMTALALFGWGQRFFTWQVGTWAAALWLASPIVLKLGGSGYIDIGLALFVTLALEAFLIWRTTRQRPWLAVCGLFVGFSMATKYTAIFFAVALGATLIVDWWRTRSVASIVIFAAGALTPSLPWFLRNWYYARDPLFPFLGNIFGLSYWSAQDLLFVQKEIAGHGMGRSFLALLSLPWHLASQPQAFTAELPFSKLLFLALPALFWFARKKGVARDVLFLLIGYLLVWFWEAQIIRYLLPAIPLLCLLTALLLETILVPLKRRLRSEAFTVLVFAVAVVLVWPGYAFARDIVWEMRTPPANALERNKFLSRFPGYRAYEFLNQKWGDRYCVYAFDGGYMNYFADGLRIGDVVGEFRYSTVKKKLTSGIELLRALRGMGADFLLVVRGEVETLPRDRYFRNHFELVYSDRNAELFHLAAAIP